jgi:hypothetical protein
MGRVQGPEISADKAENDKNSSLELSPGEAHKRVAK